MYFDLLLLIIEASIAHPEYRDHFTRGIHEGLFSPPNTHKNLVDLLSFCQVSKVWAAAAQIFLFRNVTITRKRQLRSLITTVFSNQHLALQVRTVEIRPTQIKKEYSSGTSESVVAESGFDVLPLFIHCPNIHRAELSPDMLVVGLTDTQEAQLSGLHHFVPLSGITTLWVEGGDILDLYHVLRCLPSLRDLSLRFGKGMDQNITGLNSPTFQLEQLAVWTDRGEHFQNYNWLLQSSTQSLKSLSLRWWGDFTVGRELRQALGRCGPALRHIYLIGVFNALNPLSTDSDILSLCPNVTSLKFFVRNVLDEDGISQYLSGIKQPLEHLHLSYRYYTFITSAGVKCLINAIQLSAALGTLKRLTIGTTLVHIPRALDRLRGICEGRNIILDTL